MRLAEARYHLGRAESRFHFGPIDPALARRSKQFKQAEKLLKEAIDLWTRTIGKNHWWVAEATKKLGRIERDRWNFHEAEWYFRDAIATFDAASIRGYYSLDFQVMGSLAENLADQSWTADPVDADKLLDEAHSIWKRRKSLRAKPPAEEKKIVDRIFAPLRFNADEKTTRR